MQLLAWAGVSMPCVIPAQLVHRSSPAVPSRHPARSGDLARAISPLGSRVPQPAREPPGTVASISSPAMGNGSSRPQSQGFTKSSGQHRHNCRPAEPPEPESGGRECRHTRPQAVFATCGKPWGYKCPGRTSAAICSLALDSLGNHSARNCTDPQRPAPRHHTVASFLAGAAAQDERQAGRSGTAWRRVNSVATSST